MKCVMDEPHDVCSLCSLSTEHLKIKLPTSQQNY